MLEVVDFVETVRVIVLLVKLVVVRVIVVLVDVATQGEPKHHIDESGTKVP